MVILLGLAAAVLYGTGDFLGGLASRRVQVLAVLTLAETAGVMVALPAAAASSGPARLPGLAWGIGAGLAGGLGLIIFYTGLAAGPMSVVAPVSGLASTVLPVGVALADGERPGAGVYAGALLCLAAIVLASSAGDSTPADGTSGAPRPGPATEADINASLSGGPAVPAPPQHWPWSPALAFRPVPRASSTRSTSTRSYSSGRSLQSGALRLPRSRNR